MHQLHSLSPAFQQALLRSERLRIRIVMALLGGALVVRSLRTAILFSSENLRLWVITALLIVIFLGYESLMLRAVNRRIGSGRDLPRAVWISNVVVETCLPALAMVLLSSGPIAPAYRPLANPTVLLFFPFILLSTLRLDPAACRISGAVAAVSYLIAANHLGWSLTLRGEESLLSPDRAVVGYALTFVMVGFVASAVASEIRKQVEAALLEAETKRKVEALEHDLQVARRIQQSLLPTSTPQIDGFEIAGWNQPADQTGGDYYDWQVFPDGNLLVTLGDVTGHGIGPALLAAVCRTYARANFTPENGLLHAMEHLNAALSKDIGEGRFVTFVAVICGSATSRVELLSAGHGPLLLYGLQEDRFDAMSAQGLPLGLLPDLVSEPPKTLDLRSGDLLVLTTDGFFEWADIRNEEFGVKRMENTIRAYKEKPVAEIITGLYEAVREFSGGTKQADDLTAIVIRKK